MIKNIPSTKELRDTSLRIYFKAWDVLMEICAERIHERLDDFEVISGELVPDEEGTSRNREHFIELAQPDLQMAYSMIQHSQEIGLKSKLCEISPFLLLLGTGSDVRSWAKRDSDFTKFKTIDAADLLRVADVVIPGGLPDDFKTHYEDVRGGRNKIQHLGAYRDKLDPTVLLDIMAGQYTVLYGDRPWVQERQSYLDRTRHSVFYDKRWNGQAALLQEVDLLFEILTDRQYKMLFGFSRRARRYLCIECESEGSKADASAHTALLDNEGNHAVCFVCGHREEVIRWNCRDPECPSNVLTSGDDHTCLVCNEENGDLEE